MLNLPDTIKLLSDFQLGRNEIRNKHPRVSEKFMTKNIKLKGSASQMLNLFRVFSLAVGPKVPDCDEYWQLYLLFNEICDMIFAPVLEFTCLTTLQRRIEKHHRLWARLYPGVAVYKWHALLHLVRAMLKLGPARHFRTTRYEAFHLFFKRMAQKLKNFRNITKLLSERFEKRRAMEYSEEDILPPRVQPMGKQAPVSLMQVPEEVSISLTAKYGCTDDTKFVCIASVKVKGLRYCPGDFVMIDVAMDGVQIFLKIGSIYSLTDNVILVGQVTYVTGWSSHLHAYEMQVSSEREDLVP